MRIEASHNVIAYLNTETLTHVWSIYKQISEIHAKSVVDIIIFDANPAFIKIIQQKF